MTYEFPIDPTSLFQERTPQFVSLGVPAEDVSAVRSRVTHMWTDAHGGWVYEWSRLAERYIDEGRTYESSLAYGAAKFPCLANQARRTALGHQVEQYQKAASEFPVAFERRRVTVPYEGGVVDMPVHILTPPGATESTPVLIASGGIDTWKMDLHPMYVSLALGAGVRVVGFEHPGVGELTDVPMTPAGVGVVDGLVDVARTFTTGRVGHFGLSFGGYFSGSTGLRGIVDAAVVLGGPVTHRSFGESNVRGLLFGMEDIFGNAIGLTEKPDEATIVAAAAPFALDDLVASGATVPMLVVNGDADVHVPPTDTSVFQGRDNVTTRLIEDGSHCALNKLDELMPLLVTWIRRQLHA